MTPSLVRVDAFRQLAVGQFGDSDGVPVFFFHGALASWRYRHPDDAIAERLGVRLITAARPGFGASTRNRGRTVADWAADVAVLADHLDIERFAVLGHSGGGPHALACGELLADRTTAVGAVGSLAPFGAEARFEDLGPAGRLVYQAAGGNLTELEAALERLAPLLTADIEAAMRASFPGEAMPDVPGLLELLVEDGRDALVPGIGGWADDLHALVHTWGFKLQAARVPTTLWYGEADPLRSGHGDDLAASLGVPIKTCPGGHLAVFDHWEEILRALVES